MSITRSDVERWREFCLKNVALLDPPGQEEWIARLRGFACADLEVRTERDCALAQALAAAGRLDEATQLLVDARSELRPSLRALETLYHNESWILDGTSRHAQLVAAQIASLGLSLRDLTEWDARVQILRSLDLGRALDWQHALRCILEQVAARSGMVGTEQASASELEAHLRHLMDAERDASPREAKR